MSFFDETTKIPGGKNTKIVVERMEEEDRVNDLVSKLLKAPYEQKITIIANEIKRVNSLEEPEKSDESPVIKKAISRTRLEGPLQEAIKRIKTEELRRKYRGV